MQGRTSQGILSEQKESGVTGQDVTLLKTDEVAAHVRFKGGATHTLHLPLPLPLPIGLLRKTDAAVVAEIDRLLDKHTEGEIGAILAARDVHTGGGVAFARLRVREVRRAYNLLPRYDRLRTRGYLTRHEMANLLQVGPETGKSGDGVASCAPKRVMIAVTISTHPTNRRLASMLTSSAAPRTARPLFKDRRLDSLKGSSHQSP